MASNPKGHPPFLSVYINLFYFTSSKINAIECQKDKYLMVQIWFLKFIKSILDVIIFLMLKSYIIINFVP